MEKDLVFSSLKYLSDGIRRRSFSSVEVVRAHLDRIGAINPSVNAVVQLDPEKALQEARECDEELSAGRVRGVLHGVPVTLKDTFETAGLISAAGTLGRAAHMPSQDATVAGRLRRAGAIILGKTNTPEMGLGIETDNLVYGRTNNPYDLDRSPGGSSGGPSAAVACGLSPLDIGTDGGGSIRVPAHFCGLAALKTTTGRIPAGGHFPPPFGPAAALVSLGPIARFVADLSLVLPLLVGQDWRDPSAVDALLGDPRGVEIAGLNMAFYVSDGNRPPDPETSDALLMAIEALGEAGAEVLESEPPRIGDTLDLHLVLAVLDHPTVGQWIEMAGTEELHPWTEAGIVYMRAAGEAFTIEDLAAAHYDWAEFRSDLLRFIADFDCLVSPVAAFPALPHGEALSGENFDAFSYSLLHNLTGWPVTVVRVGSTSAGMPIGVQVAAAPWCEHVTLRVAEFLETALGGWRAPPPLKR